MLRLENVTLAPAQGAPALLSGASLELGQGEMLALVGPSGAGKTSLLRAVAGEIAPLAGRIEVGGRDPEVLDRHERAKIAYVSQHHDLVDMLRVDRNVMAGALGRWSARRALRYLLWSTAAEREEALEALAAVGLSALASRRAGTLSGGERQRVAIARALVQAPALLLADEPVASLDPANAERIVELLVSLARLRGVTLICSLHQTELAQRYFPHIAYLKQGKLVLGD